jgi:CubicO group peptidase (beta-lactamase class C family)
VVQDGLAGNIRISDGNFGWSGVNGTHFWIDPNEEIVAP